MKVLVLVLCSLVLAYNNINLKAVEWNDLVKINPDEFYNFWYTKDVFEEVLYATSTVNVRTQPKKDSTKLGYVQTGESIQVTAITDNGWYEVSYAGKRGYVKEDYLTGISSSTPIEYSDIFYYNGNVSTNDMTCVMSDWELIPESIRNSFVEDGSKIIVTDEHLGLKFHNDAELNILGVTSFSPSRGNCEIYISNDNSTVSAITHEIGHYIDGKLNYPSSSDEFQTIWGSEMQFISIFHNTNLRNVNVASEYFAESCNLYIIKNEDLKSYCPLTYEYISNCFRRFE